MKKFLGFIVASFLLVLPVISFADETEVAIPETSAVATQDEFNEEVLSEEELTLPPEVLKKVRDLERTKKRLEQEEKLYGTPQIEWGWGARGEVLSKQDEGDESKRDNLQFSKLQLVPWLRVYNVTPRVNFTIKSSLNFEGRVNDRVDNRDSDKPKDDAVDNGLTLRPSKELLEALVAALELNTQVNDSQVVLLIEAGKGKIHVGEFPNSKFLDYSALEAFKIDQTGFVGLGMSVDERMELNVEFFNLAEEEQGDLGKSFNLYGAAKLIEDSVKKIRAYASATHNEPSYDNPNDLVFLNSDQNQYSFGMEVKVVNLGSVNLQYIFRENDQTRDDQGFTITYDRGLEILVAGLTGLLKYEYLDTRDPLLGKHQMSVGTKYDIWENFSWVTEVFQTSNGSNPIGSTSKEQTGALTGLQLNW